VKLIKEMKNKSSSINEYDNNSDALLQGSN